MRQVEIAVNPDLFQFVQHFTDFAVVFNACGNYVTAFDAEFGKLDLGDVFYSFANVRQNSSVECTQQDKLVAAKVVAVEINQPAQRFSFKKFIKERMKTGPTLRCAVCSYSTILTKLSPKTWPPACG